MKLPSTESAGPSHSHHGDSHDTHHSHSSKSGSKHAEDIHKVLRVVASDLTMTKTLDEEAKDSIQDLLLMLLTMAAAVCLLGIYVFVWREEDQQLGTLGDLDAIQAGRHLFRGEEQQTENEAQLMPRKMLEPCKPPKAICDPMPVLCTIGGYPPYRQWIALPPLGYCSIIIYESIGSKSIDDNGKPRSRLLSQFLRLAKQKSGWAEFGVAFSLLYADNAAQRLSLPNGTRMLAPFDEHGIVHYGVLGGTKYEYSVKKHKATLDLFRVLRQHQRQRDAGRPNLVGGLVYAIPMLASYDKEQLEIFDHIIKGFKVDMLVAVTHIGDTFQYKFDCHITGPTTWDKKYDSREVPILDAISRLYNRGYLDLDIPVAVSFTLKGFWYEPDNTDDDSDFAPGKRCGYLISETLGSYAEVCDDPDYQKQMTSIEEGHFLNYTFSKAKRLTFVFDTLSSITQKVGLAHRTHPGLSFALFDIDYEDVFDVCPGNMYGAFDRVAVVRWLTDRFKEEQGILVVADSRALTS